MRNPKFLAPTSTIKRMIAQFCNEISQEMYGLGVKKQRIELYDDKIIIFGQHKRVPALTALTGKYGDLTLTVDAALVREYKERLKEYLEKELNLQVLTILKDYDPNTENAFIAIYLKKPLSIHDGLPAS
ncbi:Na-translocating system protein MpsC family protein [Thermoflavimicrobium dichotomicum]|uniref:Uncharacterized conserved protein n=1 Tax=Thermoflavimicrobium dichotomicum TaxID=46223 RepID=A0A1I3TZG7_9BACL|nr:Na-translocating system protein MpsC family protein [Thermoflavimicrobium dichotomicum]SFJ75883.1 Uncharacterized conserved protein [Thermoflavimicrobium dichotomicum]